MGRRRQRRRAAHRRRRRRRARERQPDRCWTWPTTACSAAPSTAAGPTLLNLSLTTASWQQLAAEPTVSCPWPPVDAGPSQVGGGRPDGRRRTGAGCSTGDADAAVPLADRGTSRPPTARCRASPADAARRSSSPPDHRPDQASTASSRRPRRPTAPPSPPPSSCSTGRPPPWCRWPGAPGAPPHPGACRASPGTRLRRRRPPSSEAATRANPFLHGTVVRKLDPPSYQGDIDPLWNLGPRARQRLARHRLRPPGHGRRARRPPPSASGPCNPTTFAATVSDGLIDVDVEVPRRGRPMASCGSEVRNRNATVGHLTTGIFGAPAGASSSPTCSRCRSCRPPPRRLPPVPRPAITRGRRLRLAIRN